MGGFDEIATTGSPGIVTALGMGTVFLCLTLLYLMTRLLGRYIPRILESAGTAPVTETAASAGEAAAEGTPAGDDSVSEDRGIAAAMAIALTRHRSSRMKPEVEGQRAASPWKMAGRIRALRDR